ncbi:MAG: protein NO VEIN domain-containing protein [Mongoliitalea sp.]
MEVKTTRSDISRPFYLTRNELEVSSKNPENYFLYRLFDFDSNLNRGKCYVIAGDLTNSLTLDALVFIAYPKPNKSN